MAFTNIFTSIIGGYLIEGSNKKKLILRYQFLMFLSLFFMGISQMTFVNNIILFCVSYFIFNICWGLDSPAMNTVILDSISKNNNEDKVFRMIYWLSNLSMAIGFSLGAIINQLNKSVVMFIFSSVFFIIYIYIMLSMQDTYSKNVPTNKTFSEFTQSYIEVLKDKRYMLLIILFGIIVMAEYSMSSYVSIRLSNEFTPVKIFGNTLTGVDMFSLMMIINTVSIVFLSGIISKIIHIFKNKNIMLIGLLLYAFGYTNITYSNNLYFLLFFILCSTIGEIMYAPIIEQEKYNLTPETRRGTYSGMSNLSYSLAEILARLFIVLGTLLNSYQMTFVMAFLLLTSILFLYKTIYRY